MYSADSNRFERGDSTANDGAAAVGRTRSAGSRVSRLDRTKSFARSPRPPDQPTSLLQSAPAGPVYGCPQLECPYFERDPLLDPAGLPRPGWLFDVELGIMGSSVVERLGQTDPAGQIGVAVPGTGHTGDVVAVPMARLDWTVSPRFELGYRLPSGFGEVDVAYRFLLAEGSGSTPAGSMASPDAIATLNSHLNIHQGDLDYASRETSLGPCWGMKWCIGLRYADVFFDSRAVEPSTAGSGISSGVFPTTSGASVRTLPWNSDPAKPWGLEMDRPIGHCVALWRG